jgi:hypothetical protein
MKRHSVAIGFSAPPGGTFENLTVSLPQAGGENGQLEIFGNDVSIPGWVDLRALENDEVAERQIWSFDTQNAPKSGTDAAVVRARGVTLQDMSALLERSAVLPAVESSGFSAQGSYTLLPLDAELGTYLPTPEDCEEEGRLGPKSNLTLAREMLSASTPVDLVLHPGPGFVTRNVPRDYDVTGMTVRQVLDDLVLGNGVRWWLEEDVLVIDGRALPSIFNLSPSEAEGATVTFQDDYRTPAAEPQLSDYLARCSDTIESEDGAGGTFETFDNGTWTSAGEMSDDGAGYTAATTYTKENGKVVREVSIGSGLINTPEGEMVGRKYQSVLTNHYHPTVDEALLVSVEAVYAYADLSVLYQAEGVGAGTPAFSIEDGGTIIRPANSPKHFQTVTYRAWLDFLSKSPYLTKLTKVRQRWHAEGWLRHRLELSRELVGLLVDDELFEYDPTQNTSIEIKFLYRETTTVTSYAPLGGGLWRRSTQVIEKVDRPVVKPITQRIGEELVQGFSDVFSTMTALNVIPDSETTDSPPPTVSIPIPTCETLTCSERAHRDYNTAHAAWAASESNGASRRTYTVRYNHLRPNLRRGGTLGGGRIADITHSVGRTTPGTTTANVEVVL